MLADSALQNARSQIGVSEDPRGSNSGPMVNRYLASVGLKPGYAWCAAFVYWCHENAAKLAGVENPAPKTAGVLDMWNKAKANRVTMPRPGDVFIIDHGKGKGHAGFVERVIDDSTLETIEGNSDPKGGREGIEVLRRQRKTKTIIGYLRF